MSTPDYYCFTVPLGRKGKIFSILTRCLNLLASLVHSKIIQVPLNHPCFFFFFNLKQLETLEFHMEVKCLLATPIPNLPTLFPYEHPPLSFTLLLLLREDCPCGVKATGRKVWSYIDHWLFGVYHKWLPSTIWLCSCSPNRLNRSTLAPPEDHTGVFRPHGKECSLRSVMALNCEQITEPS